ncbi:hypothetical protein EJ04DRAFT_516743 [Polyplosphaeria fusca]|uniref:Uncharacterized protein n=1 Tax=Polyplosphaeria fusca TaxID=682080 RepID=A0A9P4QNZ8_9PLEO|nr:hypothetical protein EJ04DRAFT_516743 [Polyplosphaeria fusca]
MRTSRLSEMLARRTKNLESGSGGGVCGRRKERRLRGKALAIRGLFFIALGGSTYFPFLVLCITSEQYKQDCSSVQARACLIIYYLGASVARMGVSPAERVKRRVASHVAWREASKVVLSRIMC